MKRSHAFKPNSKHVALLNVQWFLVYCAVFGWEYLYYYVSDALSYAHRPWSTLIESIQDNAIKVAIFNSGIEFQVGHLIQDGP